MLRGKDYLIIVVGSILFAYLLSIFFPQINTTAVIISPLAESNITITNTSTTSAIVQPQSKNLAEVVQKSLEGTKGTYGIVIKNLNTQETYMQNEKQVFQPASLYKLWVMAAVYKQINEGKLTHDKVLSKTVPELNRIFDIDDETAELTEGTVTMKIDTAVEQMITISHNYAALLLTSEIKNSSLNTFLREQGLNDSKTGQPPKTTPYDIALYYEKLHAGSIVNSDASRAMTEILTRQKLNDRIPKYLPDSLEIAHKTGELGGFKHDAGIIYGSDPLLFVVLTETNAPLSAAERIAKLSQDVYAYFND